MKTNSKVVSKTKMVADVGTNHAIILAAYHAVQRIGVSLESMPLALEAPKVVQLILDPRPVRNSDGRRLTKVEDPHAAFYGLKVVFAEDMINSLSFYVPDSIVFGLAASRQDLDTLNEIADSLEAEVLALKRKREREDHILQEVRGQYSAEDLALLKNISHRL